MALETHKAPNIYVNKSILHFSIKSWNELDEKTGTLDAFITPLYLEKNAN